MPRGSLAQLCNINESNNVYSITKIDHNVCVTYINFPATQCDNA